MKLIQTRKKFFFIFLSLYIFSGSTLALEVKPIIEGLKFEIKECENAYQQEKKLDELAKEQLRNPTYISDLNLNQEYIAERLKYIELANDSHALMCDTFRLNLDVIQSFEPIHWKEHCASASKALDESISKIKDFRQIPKERRLHMGNLINSRLRLITRICSSMELIQNN